MNINEAIKKLANTAGQIMCKICVVDKVNDDERTVDVTPLDGSAPIVSVNLQANTSLKGGVVVFPEVESHVVVAMIDDTSAVVVSTEAVNRIEMLLSDDDTYSVVCRLGVGEFLVETAGGKILLSESEGVKINDGSYGGLIKIEELTNKINDLVDAFNSHTHTIPSVVTKGSATTQTAEQVSVPAILSKAAKFDKTDYENEYITHGN